MHEWIAGDAEAEVGLVRVLLMDLDPRPIGRLELGGRRFGWAFALHVAEQLLEPRQEVAVDPTTDAHDHPRRRVPAAEIVEECVSLRVLDGLLDRKSTRLNSSHG